MSNTDDELDKILDKLVKYISDVKDISPFETILEDREAVANAKQAIKAYTDKARIEWLDKQVSRVLFDIYPVDVFSEATDEDYKKMNELDQNLNTRLHCSGIRHGLHILRREARELSARDELAQLKRDSNE